MKNTNLNNNFNTSKEYYNHILKSRSNNLNSSNKTNDFIEIQLQKVLETTYKILNPIFKDDQENTTNSALKSYHNLDKEDHQFDEQLKSYIPQWLNVIINYIEKIYRIIFPKKEKLLINKIRNRNLKHYDKLINCHNLWKIKFTKNNLPP